jgi:hypothetical protein
MKLPEYWIFCWGCVHQFFLSWYEKICWVISWGFDASGAVFGNLVENQIIRPWRFLRVQPIAFSLLQLNGPKKEYSPQDFSFLSVGIL